MNTLEMANMIELTEFEMSSIVGGDSSTAAGILGAAAAGAAIGAKVGVEGGAIGGIPGAVAGAIIGGLIGAGVAGAIYWYYS